MSVFLRYPCQWNVDSQGIFNKIAQINSSSLSCFLSIPTDRMVQWKPSPHFHSVITLFAQSAFWSLKSPYYVVNLVQESTLSFLFKSDYKQTVSFLNLNYRSWVTRRQNWNFRRCKVRDFGFFAALSRVRPRSPLRRIRSGTHSPKNAEVNRAYLHYHSRFIVWWK